MKKSIIYLLSVLLVGMTMVGCEEPVVEEVNPHFPEKFSAVVNAGETYEFTIDPNMDWSLKIPNEAASFFKFIVGENERIILNGEAGTHTITVGVSDFEEFDVVRTCDIEMTMKDETKVIGTIIRGGLERLINVYTAEFNAEEDVFVQAPEESNEQYAYSTTPADRIDWVWSETNGKWMQRIVVESNFEWYLSPETPQWLSISVRISDLNWRDINDSEVKITAGRTELFLQVNREFLPLEDVACNIEFGTISIASSIDAGFEAVGSYPTEMEGCKSVCELNLASNATFNCNGEHETSADSYEAQLNGSCYSPRGAEVVVLYKDANGNYSPTGASWMRFNWDSDFPEEAGNDGVWERRFTLKVAKNLATEPREGAIAAIPVSAIQSGNYNPADYIACSIFQEGYVEIVDLGPINPDNEEAMKNTTAKFESLTKGVWPYTGSWGNIPYGYKLTYKSNSSGSDLIFTDRLVVPSDEHEASYVIYGFNETTTYDLETCWLTIEPSSRGIENGYIIKSRLGEYVDESETEKYTNPLAGAGGENEAFILFYDENEEPYAFIYFVLDPNFTVAIDRPDGTVEFATDKDYAALGATLKEIVKGDEEWSDEFAYNGTLQYLLTLNPNCTSATLLVPNYGFSVANNYSGWITTSDSAGAVTINIHPEMLSDIEEGATEVRVTVSLFVSQQDPKEVVKFTVVYKLS